MLHVSTVPVRKVKALELIRLRQMLSRERQLGESEFKERLSKIDSILILKDKNKICGIATIVKFYFDWRGRKTLGVLNDELIVKGGERDKTLLARAFHRFLWKEKILNPFRTIFWFTVTRGPEELGLIKYMSRAGARVINLSEAQTLGLKLSEGQGHMAMFNVFSSLVHLARPARAT
jgi:hypothetical protein